MLALLIVVAQLSLAPQEQSNCQTNCLGCYCDSIVGGTCIVNGGPSGCVGCSGACTAPWNCVCQPGVGGCGAVLAWCRDSDCAPATRTPTPAATNTPTPTPTPTNTPVPSGLNLNADYPHLILNAPDLGQPTQILRGQLVGWGVANRAIDIRIQTPGGVTTTYTVTTDASGRFILDDVAAGDLYFGTSEVGTRHAVAEYTATGLSSSVVDWIVDWVPGHINH